MWRWARGVQDGFPVSDGDSGATGRADRVSHSRGALPVLPTAGARPASAADLECDRQCGLTTGATSACAGQLHCTVRNACAVTNDILTLPRAGLSSYVWAQIWQAFAPETNTPMLPFRSSAG